MLSSAALRKTGSGWEFTSEEALEDFVEVHLQSLLGLTVIKRQFTVNEQRCDIIAVDENKRLVVLELKNGEDRYVVQQLTRYYDALLEHKPFADRVDYDQPVRLIAIAPKFHRDNFTDRKYHGLFFQFWQFAIVLSEDHLNLRLKDVDNDHISQVEITYQPRESTDNIPSPPREFRNLLNNFIDDEQQVIWRIREKILRFDTRMQEIICCKSISYGKGKSKLCAQICVDRRAGEGYIRPALMLWLPLSPWRDNCNRVGRMAIYNRKKNDALSLSKIDEYSYLRHWPVGSRYSASDWEAQTWDLKHYVTEITQQKNESNLLEFLINLSLKKWLQRL
ncbi:endonuclease NucS domain-containing protein [Microcoleus sp. OTE_8_concoct_300]|uniref:endonuclease NucS domain-containing protein n=1 Tax=Microcoleus sp. OTE_8_concoct_300 TaxID=2964710 RepID=UPI00403F3C09